MAEHVSHLRLELDPLIAEAKHRMRRRRSLAALLITLAGLAVGLTLTFRSSGPGPGVARPLTSSVRAGEVEVSVPRGFSHYTLTGCCGLVTGQVLTDIRLPAHINIWRALDQWDTARGSGPPSNGVVLWIQLWFGSGPTGGKRLHLPLTLDEPWSQAKLDDIAVGYRYGWFRFHNERYLVQYWSGPAAPANDRTAIRRALKSIRPHALG